MDKSEFLRVRSAKYPFVKRRTKLDKSAARKKQQIRQRLTDLLEEKQESYFSGSLFVDDDFNTKDSDEKVDSNQPENQNNSDNVDLLTEHSPLFVLEAEDFNDLTISEVAYIWENRLLLCGSVEAGAEALALLELDREVVTSYLGWQHYVNSPDLKELRQKLQEQRSFDTEPQVEYKWPPYDTPECVQSRSELLEKSVQEIEAIWNKRPHSLGSVEVACEVLSLLRHKTGIDKTKQNWRRFLEHPAIEPLAEELPESAPSYDEKTKVESFSPKGESEQSISSLEYDNRKSTTQKRKVRSGQQNFRTIILERFMGRCCVTQCSEVALLEAAHIIPYMGEHSNVAENGLCLRVDIHKLFDRFLISIDPEEYILNVSDKIKDSYYRSLHHKRLFNNGERPQSILLKKHYETFCRMENKN